MTPMWAVALVGIGTALVSAWTGRVISRKSEINLDEDSLSCRAAWASDVVCGSALFFASLASLGEAALGEERSVLLFVAPGTLLLVSVGLLCLQVRHHKYRINGYPESLHPRIKPIMRRREVLLPGVVLGVLGQVLLLAVPALSGAT
jgi:hypothetical protein